MEIKSAEFVASYPKEDLCPKDGRPEFAFIGRSNVGKSSLLNMLTARKGLAKVSGTPGKTRLLNYFLINQSWYLVDLPGYGYAKVSKSEQQKLASMIEEYLGNHTAMLLAFVLIDGSIPPSKTDLNFINGLGKYGVPFALVFTKADRLGKSKLDENIQAFFAELSKSWETLPPYFVTSSSKPRGREEILDYLDTVIRAQRKK